MANVVEDGTGLSNANAYINVAFADTYFTERNDTAWSGTTVEKEAFILRATDYIELIFGYKFLGKKFLESQALSFPRLADDGVTADAIPLNLKKACAEYARIAKTASLIVNPALPTDGLVVTEISKDVVGIKKSVKYDANQSPIIVRPYPTADSYLRGLIRSPFAGVIRN
jgi:hypothetical protein